MAYVPGVGRLDNRYVPADVPVVTVVAEMVLDPTLAVTVALPIGEPPVLNTVPATSPAPPVSATLILPRL